MAEQSEAPGAIVIGDGVVAKGVFTVPGRAIVNGTLEGELQAKELVVGVKGRAVGKFRAETADISGEVHETLQTTGSLVIRPTGKIKGTIYYRDIEIQKGGEIEGRMSQGTPPQNAGLPTAPAAAPATGTGSGTGSGTGRQER